MEPIFQAGLGTALFGAPAVLDDDARQLMEGKLVPIQHNQIWIGCKEGIDIAL